MAVTGYFGNYDAGKQAGTNNLPAPTQKSGEDYATFAARLAGHESTKKK